MINRIRRSNQEFAGTGETVGFSVEDRSDVLVANFGGSKGKSAVGGTAARPSILNLRSRVAIADINAGPVALVPALKGFKARMVDYKIIAIGGAAAGLTALTLNGTQATVSVALTTIAQANLTENTLQLPHSAGHTLPAAGASWVANDVNTAITLSKTGGAITTATHIDVILSFVLTS